MRGLHLVALLGAAFIALQVDDVSADIWQKIGRETRRIGHQIGDEATRVRKRVQSWVEPRVQREEVAQYQQTNDAPWCVALVDASVSLDCHLAGEPVNCREPAQVGTVAVMKCASGYQPTHRHGYNSITCNDTHVWSNRLIKCLPDCGRQNAVGGREFISKGKIVTVGEFAWHVGIYHLNESQLYSQICGGSLITPAFVVTAAHCFWDLSTKKVRVKELFSIAAGKYKIDWYTDDREIQRRNLSEIHLGPRFSGDRHFLAYDIALLRLDRDIKLSLLVNTICLDFRVELEDRHLQPGKNGSIAGWGITELNEPSDVLKSVQLPYIPVEDCECIVEAKFIKYLTHDKFCAGYRNMGTSICPGDSGGGYAFPQETADGTRFYLRGIASVGHRARSNTGLKCQTEQVAGFTKVSTYRRWIENIVFPPE